MKASQWSLIRQWFLIDFWLIYFDSFPLMNPKSIKNFRNQQSEIFHCRNQTDKVDDSGNLNLSQNWIKTNRASRARSICVFWRLITCIDGLAWFDSLLALFPELQFIAGNELNSEIKNKPALMNQTATSQSHFIAAISSLLIDCLISEMKRNSLPEMNLF